MNDGNTPKSSRKQAEADILRHMRAILTRIKSNSNVVEKQSNENKEPVDKQHILSIVSRFTNLKKTTKH